MSRFMFRTIRVHKRRTSNRRLCSVNVFCDGVLCPLPNVSTFTRRLSNNIPGSAIRKASTDRGQIRDKGDNLQANISWLQIYELRRAYGDGTEFWRGDHVV